MQRQEAGLDAVRDRDVERHGGRLGRDVGTTGDGELERGAPAAEAVLLHVVVDGLTLGARVDDPLRGVEPDEEVTTQ